MAIVTVANYASTLDGNRNLCVASNGNAYAIVSDYTNYYLRLYKITGGSATLLTSELFTSVHGTGATFSQASMVIDGSDVLHIICAGLAGGTRDVAYRAYDTGTESWVGSWALVKSLNAAYSYSRPTVCIDSNGKLHVCYGEQLGKMTLVPVVQYTNNVSGSWLTTENISDPTTSHENGVIGIDGNNYIHAYYFPYNSTSWTYRQRTTSWQTASVESAGYMYSSTHKNVIVDGSGSWNHGTPGASGTGYAALKNQSNSHANTTITMDAADNSCMVLWFDGTNRWLIALPTSSNVLKAYCYEGGSWVEKYSISSGSATPYTPHVAYQYNHANYGTNLHVFWREGAYWYYRAFIGVSSSKHAFLQGGTNPTPGVAHAYLEGYSGANVDSSVHAYMFCGSVATPSSIHAYLDGIARSSKAAFLNGQLLYPSDNFNDNSLDTDYNWIVDPYHTQDTGVTVEETNKEIRITTISGSDNANGLRSKSTFDLTDRAAIIELHQAAGYAAQNDYIYTWFMIVDSANAYHYLQIRHPSGDGYTGIQAIWFDDFTWEGYAWAYPGTTRWLRIRHQSSNDTIYFDVSTDGVSWSNRYYHARTFAITSVYMYIEAGTTTTDPGEGGLTVFDNANVTDWDPVSDNQPAYLKGQSTASSSLHVFLDGWQAGGTPVSDSSPAYLKGGVIDDRYVLHAYLLGEDQQVPAFLWGSIDIEDSQSAYTVGGLSSSTPAFTQGDAWRSYAHAYMEGVAQIPSVDNQPAFLWGGVLVTGNVPGYLLGNGVLRDSQPAFARAEGYPVDSQPAYLSGVVLVSDSVSCFVSGLVADIRSSIHAFMGNPVYRTSIHAFCDGLWVPGVSDMANAYITLTTSDASLSKRFRVLAEGYSDGNLSKAQQVERTIGGGLDVSHGAVFKQWSMVIRVKHTETDSNYGTLAELETFYKLNKPNATRSPAVTLVDHHNDTYTVILLGELQKNILGCQVEGTDAHFLVKLSMMQTTGVNT